MARQSHAAARAAAFLLSSPRLENANAPHVEFELNEDVATAASAAGLASLVLNGTQTVTPEFSPNVRQRLETAHRRNVATNLHLLGHLRGVSDALIGRGIDTLAYKGPAVGAILYGRQDLRQSGDVDVLIRHHQVRDALDCLEDAGYRPREKLSAAELNRFVSESCQLHLNHHGDGTLVEVHWDIVPSWMRMPVGVAEFFDRAEGITLANMRVRVPSAPDLVRALIVHGTKHRWSSPKWIADIAWGLERLPAHNWGEVVYRMSSGGQTRLLSVAIALARRVFRASVPAPLETIPADATASRMAAEIYRDLLSGRNPERKPRQQAFWIGIQSASRTKLGLAAHLATAPSVEFRQATGIPPQLDFLNRIARPAYLLGKATGAAFKKSSRPY